MQVFLDSSSEVYNIYVGMYVKGISDQNTRIYASSLNNVIITLISYNLTEIQCICKMDFGKVFMKRTVFKIFQKFGCRKRSQFKLFIIMQNYVENLNYLDFIPQKQNNFPQNIFCYMQGGHLNAFYYRHCFTYLTWPPCRSKFAKQDNNLNICIF